MWSAEQSLAWLGAVREPGLGETAGLRRAAGEGEEHMGEGKHRPVKRLHFCYESAPKEC